MLARRTTAEVLPGEQNACATILWRIQQEGRIGRTVAVVAPVKEKHVTITGALNPLQKLLGDDLVRIDIVAPEHSNDSAMNSKALHRSVLIVPVAHVDESARDRRCGGHGRAHQMRATAGALPAFKVAVAGGGATLTRAEPGRIP